MKQEEKDKSVISQMAWILNYQPTIQEQHIHMVSQTVKQEEPTAEEATGDDAPEQEKRKTEQEKEPLNLFAPKINLQQLLHEEWFAEVRTDAKYDGRWTDAFIEALMASEYGEGIARQWAVSGVRNKRDQIKGYVVGLLKDAGVLKGSYDGIARLVDPSDTKRRLSHYMSEGKRQPYAEWIKKYEEVIKAFE